VSSSLSVDRSPLGLGPFLNELESRLQALSVDETRAALLAYAESLPMRARSAFLGVFGVGESTENGGAGGTIPAPAGAALASDTLLSAVEVFVKRLESGSYVEGWGWDDDLHDERSFGDESWADEMDILFSGAGSVFLEGDLALARMAYERLLKAFDDNADGFCGAEEPEQMLDTDIGEAKARYLRAVYETTALPERAEALLAEMGALRYVGDEATLQSVADVQRAMLPDLEVFLPAWIAWLGKQTKRGSSPGDLVVRDVTRLRSEAAQWSGGADALAELAREPGSPDAEVHRDWVDALTREGRVEAAAAAAREALERIQPHGVIRAGIAERLARFAAAQGDGEGVLEGRRESWRSAPSTRRLLELVDTATALGVADRVLVEEADWAEPSPKGTQRRGVRLENDRLACELLLLAGLIDSVVARLSAAPALGWSAGEHPGPIVVPYLLVAVTGIGGRPQAEKSLLAKAFEQIDVHGWVDTRDYHEMAFDDEIEESLIDPRFRAIDRDELLLSRLFADALAERHPSSAERTRWLSAVRVAIEQRVAAVVEAKRRGAYERVAQVAVVYAEALTLVEEQRAGAGWLDSLRERYPRHTAFRAELDAAARKSPFLPAPIRTKRR
jgi:hypothetical protein